ncbi:phospholipase c [Trichoderma arundinaceum]|uniref:Phosphoinositide phospholipase C n=1 Tax=Trichoderma arundinaceum TaxID=490622 RepID=A0A395NGS8_TRIAR|nr:phospholipase c [Trichoderma arundinaceum]
MTSLEQATSPSLQSGGGTGTAQRTVSALSSSTLAYLKRLFEAHATPEGKWTNEQVRVFLQKVQGHDVTTEAATQLLSTPNLDLSGFLAFMTSSHNAALLPMKNEDFSWPLASYYISSSHNTYLTGNQLSSDSTTGAYTNVLLRGCRCVEIDVWDGDESDSESDSSDSETSDDEAAAKKAALKEKKKKEKKEKKESKDKKKPGWSDQLKNKMEKINISKKIEKIEEKATEKANEIQEAVKRKSESASIIEPRVLHGYTLTGDVPFRDVCVAIRESAFVVSDMPLIVSLEVHCSAKQQIVMVDIMKEVWDGLLVAEPESEIEKLPSPNDLRRKILIKVKHVPPGTPLDKVDTIRSEQVPVPTGPPPKPAKTIQELARLGIYTQGVTFKAWTQPEATMPTHIFSISEKKFIDFHSKQWSVLFNHNKRYLLRAYPAGFRIGSSNLNPAIFWGGGAQIIALNWQETDEGMMLNEGMFTGTGGYVLKPEGYRPKLTSKDETSDPITIPRKSLNLVFTFLSAQNIPLPPSEKSAKGFKPYIKVELHAEGSKNSHAESDGHVHESEYKVRTKTHKGCDLDLGAEKLEFKGIPGLVEELTFVRFTIRDDEIGRDDLAAWACIRLDRLGQGYRFVHLRDTKGVATEGAILVKVERLAV